MKNYISKFKQVISEADELKDNYKYVTIEFFGIILCFLNYYNTFISIVNELFTKKNRKNYMKFYLFIIPISNIKLSELLIFLINSLIILALNKDFAIFEKSLHQDIETFLKVIEKNKEVIFNKYNSQKKDKIIKLDNLKFNEKEKNNISKKDIKQIKNEFDSETEKKKGE